MLKLGIGLAKQFPLDLMHLIYLGVMKRLIKKYWLEGKIPHKFSRSHKNEMNCILKNISKNIPAEFGRKIRTFEQANHRKAVEFRFFLLYCGINSCSTK